ncbi:MFS transporter [Saccharothrix syringae]|uniref:MFS transporter n=1 Tax=Saccharothrix syringae TaxID=103733 RepID=UPI00068D1AA8|nr:MFS transporter [Saccharothrix syringae]
MATLSPEQTGTRAAAGLAVLCTAHFLIGADGLAVAIALPSVQQDLGVPALDAQWLLSAYGSAFAGTLLLGGRAGDLYGRRRLLVLGMALFAGGSLAAGVAPGLVPLIAARLVQGLGAAAAVPAALALISSVFPPGRGRTRALSLLGAMATVGIMSGLVVGGLVTDLVGWRWVFLLTAAPAVAAAVSAARVLPEARAAERGSGPPDVAGAVLLAAGLMSFVLGVTRAAPDGFAAAGALVPLVAGAVLLAGFVLRERRAREPLVRFRILRLGRLRAASLGIGVNALAFTSIVYVGTQYLQNVQGYSALRAGMALLPIDVAAFLVALLAGGPLARRSPRAALSGAFVLTASALLWLARVPVPADYPTDLMAPLVVLGAALSAIFVVATHEAVADAPPDERGLASGVFETANHLFGGALGAAAYATVLATAAGTAQDPGGYRAAFLVATALVVVLGLPAAVQAGGRRSATPENPAPWR